MKIAITDACIFIDLHELQLTSSFFKLDIEVHTSVDVLNELYSVQKEVLMAFQAVQKLWVHNILEDDRLRIQQARYPRSLSSTDQTVLFLAEKLNAMLLSSDKAVRHHAKNKAIECHGMLWIFDQLVQQSLIPYHDAIAKLKMLISTNIVYQNNVALIQEVNHRIKKWQKQA